MKKRFHRMETLSQDKPEDTKRSFLLFLKLLFKQKGLVVVAIVANLIGSALYTAVPWLMGIIIDKIGTSFLETGSIHPSIDFITKLIGFLILMLIANALFSFVFSYISERILADLSEGSTQYLREQLSKKFTKLPLSFYDTHKVGSLLSLYNADADKVSEILVVGFNQFMLAFFDLIFGISIMLYIDIPLTLIILVIIFISMLATYFISQKSQIAFGKNLATLANYNAVVEEMYSGSMIIKSFNTQEHVTKQVEEANKEQYYAHKKAQFMNYIIYPTIRFISQLAFVVSAFVGGVSVLRGQLTIGVVQAYLQYVSQVSEPVTQFAYIINSMQSALASIERIYKVLDEPEEEPNPIDAKVLDKVSGQIKFNHISFGYDASKPLMKDVSFQANPSQSIAIVGPTGAGKTTLVNLLMRFYEVDQGEIYFDGVCTKDMTREYMRSLFGMVLQDTWLFRGSVADNIAYGNKDASREDIIAAAKLAQCDSFIKTLPQGYDTIISSEQSVLSQGQQQLLTIARVALVNPQVLILDEATSSIDTITEIKIQQAIDALMKNKTSFIIAHRLSTIRNADLILVMDQGNIIESGTHEELLEKDGFYANLYNH